MEVAMEVDDDVFFADLNEQISLLIMDDDDDDVGPALPCPPASLQALSRAIHPNAQFPFSYEQPCRRQQKGTGVFIPRSSQPRRKNRQGRASCNAKSHRQQPENNSRGTSQNHVSYHNKQSYDCFKPKRS